MARILFDSPRLHQTSPRLRLAGQSEFMEISGYKGGHLGKGRSLKYVYLLKSIPFPKQRYIGSTSDLQSRLKAHNEGQSSHTSKYKPWKLVAYIAFSAPDNALEFEKYLKSGSGRAFAKTRFWEGESP